MNVPPTATPIVVRFVNVPAVLVQPPTAGVGTNMRDEVELGTRFEVDVELGGGTFVIGVTACFVMLK